MKKNVSSALDWLLESDDIGVRYLALRDLTKADRKELATAKKAAHTDGPIAAMHRLGGSVITASDVGASSLAKGESISEQTARLPPYYPKWIKRVSG